MMTLAYLSGALAYLSGAIIGGCFGYVLGKKHGILERVKTR